MIKKLCHFVIIGTLFTSVIHALPNPARDPRVGKVYDYFHGEFIWIKDGAWTPCGKALLEVFSHVDEEGLWPEDYLPLVDTLQQMDLKSPEYQKIADELLTLAVLNYISDMKGERLNPNTISKSIYLKQVAIDEVSLLREYLSLPDQCRWVYGLAPASTEYQHLKQLLSLYRQKRTQGGWPQLPKGTKLKKGDKGPLVETLRTQLIAQDVLPSGDQGSHEFDEVVEDAVKTYQELHGLETDGIVGGATLTALNTSVDDRIKAIIVNMERQRWLPHPLPARYIQVNIPGFYLKAVEDRTPKFYMRVITGKEYSKTPVFNAQLTEIIFNPAWHVPASIVRELLPKIRSNPGAYARKGYQIYEGDSVRIVQSPGPANALGKIRFTLESPYSLSIYLHGTPQQNLFQKAQRDFSHGCVRVENPDVLAAFVFKNPKKWTYKRILEEASGTKTKHVKLDQPLPVFVTYFTVFEGEGHKMHFVEDQYHQDEATWQALKKSKRKDMENVTVSSSL